MPLKKCSSEGQSGWKWGDEGHCYIGPDAKKKAIKQGYAIDKEKFKKEIIAEVRKGAISKEEVATACEELSITDMMFWVAVNIGQKESPNIKELSQNE